MDSSTAPLTFLKMHVLGNDFMLIDVDEQIPRSSSLSQNDAIGSPLTKGLDPSVLAHINSAVLTDEHDLDSVWLAMVAPHTRAWSHRFTGIGFDQLILMARDKVDNARVHLRFLNADGSISPTCGNGTLAASFWALSSLGASPNPPSAIRAATIDGPDMLCEVAGQDMALSMSAHACARVDDALVGSMPLWGRSGNHINAKVFAVDMGNPHLVFWMMDAPLHEDKDLMGGEFDPYNLYLNRAYESFFKPLIQRLSHSNLTLDCLLGGAKITLASFFDRGANITLAWRHNQSESNAQSIWRVHARVWERGVGPTLSCGSAAGALACSASACQTTPPPSAFRIEWATGAMKIQPIASQPMACRIRVRPEVAYKGLIAVTDLTTTNTSH